jgi:hypothetical protein
MEIHCGTEQKIVRLAQSLTQGFLSQLLLQETGRNVNLTTRPHPVQILRTSGVVSLIPPIHTVFTHQVTVF